MNAKEWSDRTWISLMPPEVAHVRSPLQRGLLTLALFAACVLTVATVITVGGLVFGCTPARQVCTVVHAADDVCHAIEFVDASGRVVTVPLGADEIRALAEHAAARAGVQIAPQGVGRPPPVPLFPVPSGSASAKPAGSK